MGHGSLHRKVSHLICSGGIACDGVAVHGLSVMGIEKFFTALLDTTVCCDCGLWIAQVSLDRCSSLVVVTFDTDTD